MVIKKAWGLLISFLSCYMLFEGFFFQNTCSIWLAHHSRVPQGSILGPPLLIFVDELPTKIESRT